MKNKIKQLNLNQHNAKGNSPSIFCEKFKILCLFFQDHPIFFKENQLFHMFCSQTRPLTRYNTAGFRKYLFGKYGTSWNS
jgi:hypothetical protein